MQLIAIYGKIMIRDASDDAFFLFLISCHFTFPQTIVKHESIHDVDIVRCFKYHHEIEPCADRLKQTGEVLCDGTCP